MCARTWLHDVYSTCPINNYTTRGLSHWLITFGFWRSWRVYYAFVLFNIYLYIWKKKKCYRVRQVVYCKRNWHTETIRSYLKKKLNIGPLKHANNLKQHRLIIIYRYLDKSAIVPCDLGPYRDGPSHRSTLVLWNGTGR